MSVAHGHYMPSLSGKTITFCQNRECFSPFKDDTEAVNGEKSMSEDERVAYQIALKKMMKSTKGKVKTLPLYSF